MATPLPYLLLLICFVLPVLMRDEAATRDCIIGHGSSVNDICKTKKERNSCLNSYESTRMCLLLNECNNVTAGQDMKPLCWECWAHLEVDSHDMVNFQKAIHECWESTTAAVTLGFLCLAALTY